MRNIVLLGLVTTAGCINAPQGHDAVTERPNVAASHAKQIPSESVVPPTRALDDLDAMTFDCPKAGLNAAAREASKVPAQGTYQFSYFRIINDAHHATYEVHFKSNYVGEPELQYCVSIYCQQGWDPAKTMVSVTPMSSEARAATCGEHADTRKTKRPREIPSSN
jgi:hypothetical protein